VNADDLGLSAAVNAGILEAHAAGSVTSASMMVHCAGWEDAVRRGGATPSLRVGLHFNLLVGAPLTGAPSLSDRRTGRYPSLQALVAKSLAGSLDADEIAAECESQLDALSAAGFTVTHIDSHRHTHALPRIHRAVARVAARRRLPLRRPVESVRWFPGDLAGQVHRALVSGSWYVSALGAPGTRAADSFIGICLQGGDGFAGRIAFVLDHLPAGTTELIVHPGRVDDALRAADGYTWQRERELEALVSPGLLERLRRPDLSLIAFDAL